MIMAAAASESTTPVCGPFFASLFMILSSEYPLAGNSSRQRSIIPVQYLYILFTLLYSFCIIVTDDANKPVTVTHRRLLFNTYEASAPFGET
jgi:hypothetical protein